MPEEPVCPKKKKSTTIKLILSRKPAVLCVNPVSSHNDPLLSQQHPPPCRVYDSHTVLILGSLLHNAICLITPTRDKRGLTRSFRPRPNTQPQSWTNTTLENVCFPVWMFGCWFQTSRWRWAHSTGEWWETVRAFKEFTHIKTQSCVAGVCALWKWLWADIEEMNRTSELSHRGTSVYILNVCKNGSNIPWTWNDYWQNTKRLRAFNLQN